MASANNLNARASSTYFSSRSVAELYSIDRYLDFVAGSFDEENIKIAMSVVYRDARKGCNRSEFVYE